MIDRSLGHRLVILYDEYENVLQSYIDENYPMHYRVEYGNYQTITNTQNNAEWEFRKHYGISSVQFLKVKNVVLYFDSQDQLAMFCMKFL